ncbi:MAG: hypothetical protein KAT26_11515, partial [Marinosulfonomonas sp.]|nr:hypothetical protein [Marinosulfonomonas sp.]
IWAVEWREYRKFAASPILFMQNKAAGNLRKTPCFTKVQPETHLNIARKSLISFRNLAELGQRLPH